MPFASLKVRFDGTSGNKIEETVSLMMGSGARLTHRPDGKPEILGCPNGQISFSHSGPLTLILCGSCSLGCDVEQIVSHETAQWRQLLGHDGFGLAELIAEKCQSPLATAATHVWTLRESLRKAGTGFSEPIRLELATPDNWAIFDSGRFASATFHTCVQDLNAAFAFGFVVRKTP